MDFKDMFGTSVTDYEFSLSQISELISSNKRMSENRPNLAGERLALTLRYLDIGEFFSLLATNFEFP